MSNYCPECGSDDFREPFNDGHRQCNDRSCLQEFFTDVNYLETVPDVLKAKHKKISQLEKENADLKEMVTLYLPYYQDRCEGAYVSATEYNDLKAQLAHVESEYSKEKEVTEFYAEGELPCDLEIRPEKKELWSISEKWSQRSMSDHYCGNRARQRIKERKDFNAN